MIIIVPQNSYSIANTKRAQNKQKSQKPMTIELMSINMEATIRLNSLRMESSEFEFLLRLQSEKYC